ncbi:MAG TPA: AAA family ATPase [Thermoanaerobaculaceae bacterium]|nr:AAA family ATPase [Thermoanaerobaculaceae bacterium]HPS77399.1 AAA family ATPase [Thermoanaerobaculaceae bacterium]
MATTIPLVGAASRRGLIVMAWVALTVALASPVLADFWYEHYARAEKALASEDWAKAVEELNLAIQRKGDPGARERSYGMRVVAYFPYLKLGIAYTGLGQHEAALQAFDTEERLGAIRDSEEALDELRRVREVARAGQRKAAETAAGRVAAIVQQSLQEADGYEREGHLAEAMSAVGRALAVAPEHAEATARMARLRETTRVQERAREDEAGAARLVAEARTALDARQWAAAASLLRQALSQAPGGEAEGLLRRAEEGLRASLAADSRQGAASRGLEEARSLAETGKITEAMERLQPVLVAEPGNTDAIRLQARLLEARRASERGEATRRAVAEGESELAAGRVERALVAANRALALDAADPVALGLVQRAYAAISRTLLGAGGAGRLPPAIRFVDQRETLDDGSRVQVVREPDLRLDGVILDRSEVTVSFLDDRDRAVAGESRSQSVGELVLTEFSLRPRLAPGRSTFRLRASNAAGLSSSAEYTVLYRRPLARSPWVLGGAAAVLAAAAGTLVAMRARRRRELRRRKYNPFVAGAPVLDERLFFGRERLIQRVLQTVHNNSLLLFGERRIGKTSLLHQLKRRLGELDDPVFAFFPVFVDLQGTPEDRFFATLATEVVGELGPLLPPGTVDPAAPRGVGYGYRELVAELVAVIDALARITPKQVKVVLLIDEVDELNAYDPRINQRLRSLFMRAFSEHLVAVVSGVEIRRQWEQHGSPWYNFFEEIEVTPIDREDAAALIRTPLRGVFTVEDAAVAAILDRTGCRPYQIQKTCVALVDRLHQQGRTVITRADVEAVAGEGAP